MPVVRSGSESQRLLLLGKVKTFSHFVDEGGGLDVSEVENEEGVDPVVERCGEEDFFPFQETLDLCETLC